MAKYLYSYYAFHVGNSTVNMILRMLLFRLLTDVLISEHQANQSITNHML
jgi:hypothetical protein